MDERTPLQIAYEARKKKGRTLAARTSSLVRAWRNKEPTEIKLRKLARAWSSYKSALAKEDELFTQANRKMQSR